MSLGRRYLVATAPGRDASSLVAALEERGEVVAHVDSGGGAVTEGEALRPSVALLDLELPGLSGLEAGRELQELLPDVAVVMMSYQRHLPSLLDAIAAGAAGFLVHPVPPEELTEELDRIEALRARDQIPAPRRAPGQGIWSFLSAKSGEGRTTTLLAFAEQLRSLGREVVVVDLDLQFGDVGFLLGLEEGQPDILDAMPEPGKVLAREELQACLRQHSSDLPVLMAPTLPRNLEPPRSSEDLGQLVENLAELYEYVLVDFPVGIPAHLISVLDRSRLVLVSTRNLPSVIEANLVLKDILRSLGYGPTKLRVLVLEDQLEDEREKLHRSLKGIAGVLTVPFVPDAVEAAMRAGQPLFHGDPGAAEARAFRRLVLDHVGRAGRVTLPAPQATTPPSEP